MSSDGATIRHATREDVPAILGLIEALADYEKEKSSCHATEEKLAKTLSFAIPSGSSSEYSFTPGFAKTYILTAPDGKVAGMALYFYNYSTWKAVPGIYLEDLFVLPEYRKRGYGKALIKTLAKEVVAMGGGRLEWSCLKWNTPSLEFYGSLGAKQMDGWVGLRVDEDALTKLAEK
ncbi:GCN5-related N-acetyltransferas-like protein [Lojkania enalia]|uniref:GCN5-related N-acetyltransferas-like protein n=1 Tax=Lojkania enalia TaxID=147567 RepID=A0A9P4JYJ1_9PLEO|nr:GCN5-related N-acetyltransferas-like protein [Didymosphaeria enalia]